MSGSVSSIAARNADQVITDLFNSKFKLCKKLHIIICLSQFNDKKWGSQSSLLSYKTLKLNLRVFLAGYIVAMISYCATKLTATCSPIVGHCVDIMSLASPDMEWL